jgi:thioredoxin 2
MAEQSAFIRCNRCNAINRIPADKLLAGPKCGKCKNPLGYPKMPIDVNPETFDREVLGWPGAVLVEFFSSRCGHCMMMTPFLEEIAREKAGFLKVVIVNIDKDTALVARFQIRATPMFMVYRNGNKLSDIAGALPKAQLEAWIDSSLL